MTPASRAKRGFALFAALITISIVGAFVAGAWAIALREFRASAAESSVARAATAADFASVAPVERWVPGDALTIPVGGVLPSGASRLSGGAGASWQLQRLTRATFLAVGQGTDGNAYRATSLLLRLALPDFDTTGTLTVRDSAIVHAGAVVSGTDVVPAGWVGLGCATGPASAGTVSPDSTHVCDGTCGSPGGTQVTGRPARLADSTAADSARYTIFGSETWSSLVARASVRLPPNAIVTPTPAVSGTVCDRAASSNWGDPLRATPCRDYFPVIWAAGDVTVRGGGGQGILLVEGDATLDASASFTGVIVSRDDVRSGAGGAHVVGQILAQDRDVSDGRHPEVLAGGVFERSRCAVTRATEGMAFLRRVRERSWSPMYR